jgi:hypothetical protein
MRKSLLLRVKGMHMTNLPSKSNSDTSKDTGLKPNRGSPPGLPRWVKVLGIIFIVALVLVWVTMNLIIGSPGGHIPLMP